MNAAAAPSTEQSIHTTRLHVQPDDMIRGFHIHYSVYLRYLEAAAVEHMDALGATINDLLARYQAGFVVRHADIEYLAPAMSGDDLDVRTWIESVQGASDPLDGYLQCGNRPQTACGAGGMDLV
jgi:acyl-CoA thioester hydrolase